ncbi:MAG: ABC transporter ATP-binding protein [Rhodothermales bacterium]|nr:ABC transporter ATP-binding protein [Rhodothermales bacterium]
MPSLVAADALSKQYRSRWSRRAVQALEGLTLTVEPGEIFGLLGPNGAGKTTLVKILLGLVHPTTGVARLSGIPAHRPDARRRVGYLPENHRFPGFLTAGQLLDLYGQMSGVPAAERHARIPALLDRVRLSDWRDTRVRKFSKGMMQRLGLAQALLNEPDLVFLDEPTDGVDPIGRREIRDLLLWLRGRGTTVFLNSHLLSEVEQVCTRVAILNRGRLVREGTVADLTSEALDYEIVCTPVPPALAARLAGALAEVNGAPPAPPLARYLLRAADRADLNHVLDALRSAGVQLDAVLPRRRTLEDYFIEVVQAEDAQHHATGLGAPVATNS